MRPGPVRRGLYHVHFLVAAVTGALAFVLLSAIGLLYVAVFPRNRNAAVLLARSFHHAMAAVLGWRIRVENRELLAANAPAIWMARHQSNLDIVTHGGIYPRDTVVLGKKQVAKIPVFGWFFRATRNILLDRGDLATAIASIRAAAARIREERISVWVFPEGHRNLRPQLLPFKKGVFHLAVEAQVPIVPIVSDPIITIIDGHGWMCRPGRYRIKVLPPVSTAGLTGDDVASLMETVRGRMQAEIDALTATARAPIGPQPRALPSGPAG